MSGSVLPFVDSVDTRVTASQSGSAFAFKRSTSNSTPAFVFVFVLVVNVASRRVVGSLETSAADANTARSESESESEWSKPGSENSMLTRLMDGGGEGS